MTGELVSPKTQRLHFPNINCSSPPDQKCMALVALTPGSSALAHPLIFYSLSPDLLHLEAASQLRSLFMPSAPFSVPLCPLSS